MAGLPPRTIVIRQISPQQSQLLKRAAPTQFQYVQQHVTDFKMELPDEDGEDNGATPRKRQRLTNLSPEDRMLRRKLKNRVAAQTARDRKKEKFDVLEEALARIEAENKRLRTQNQTLQVQKTSLTTENERLRERLGVVAPPGSVSLVKREPVSTLESAAGSTDTGLVPGGDQLHRVATHSKPDVLLSILKQIQADASVNLVEIDSISGGDSSDDAQTVAEETTSPDVMVGPTAIELESVKELIKFDHIYYKPTSPKGQGQPSTFVEGHVPEDIEVEIDSEVMTSSEDDSNSDTALLDIDELLDLTSFNWDSMNHFDFDALTASNDALTESSYALTESSYALTESGDIAPVESNDITPVTLITAPVTKPTTEPKSNAVNVNITTSCPAPSYVDFAPDYGLVHSPLLNDSVYGSDLSEIGSPQSDMSTTIDDLWGDTFTELFPSLA